MLYKIHSSSHSSQAQPSVDMGSTYRKNRDFNVPISGDSAMKKDSNQSTLVDLLRYRARARPDETAYTFLKDGDVEEDRLTYARIDQQVRAIAARLQSISTLGERALLLYPAGLDFVAAFFACLYAGIIAVPSYPPRRNRPDPRFQAIAADAQVSVVMSTRSILSEMRSRLSKMPELRDSYRMETDTLDAATASNWQMPDIQRDTLAFLQYTSGSTGNPKGVMISHGNLLHNAEYIKQGTGLTQDDLSLTWLPNFHDMGLMNGLIQPLYMGFPSILMAPLSFLQHPIRWLRAISRHKVTYSGGPNFAYDLCLRRIAPERRRGLDLKTWRIAYNGAEPIRGKTLEQFVRYFGICGFRTKSLYPCYGLAESTVAVTGGFLEDGNICLGVGKKPLEQGRVIEAPRSEQETNRLVRCGKVQLDGRIVIANPETLSPRAPDEVGEILVSGDSVARGYWNRPEETEQTFRVFLANTDEGPFMRTGDLGFLKNGELFVTGRLKDLIIVRGRNCYPQDIESTVERSHPALSSGGCAAFSVDSEGEERLVVVQEVERTALRKLDADEVILAIRNAVSEQHELQVHEIVLLRPTAIPKTSSGKIQRGLCKRKFLADDLDVIPKNIARAEQKAEKTG
uniref:Acyl-CoA synthetase (AMP-forming)/AMP-acid ligase II n=1 Tax=Candidatus Kentrum sp. TC TaxID=2126339 RepID=A0A450YEK2_9GAMM|nr:MAG: Acyl-CoA synthetase (AMP-forming)/AMP-acid ligase II [Candidatus Kentron sp. TC]